MPGRRFAPARFLSARLARGSLSLIALVTMAAGVPLVVSGAANADPSPDAWAALRSCESGGNYQVVSKSGKHMGAYQFDQGTWNSVGGTGKPNEASPYEQDFRALYLYRMRGWQPWTCAKSKRLAEDTDARSRRVPTSAEATAVAGNSPDGTVTGPVASTDTTTPGVTPTEAAPWPAKQRYYRYGSCAKALRTFQLALNVRGYPVTFQGTGCYYTKTKTAVLAIQSANGIPAHGKLNKRTWNAAFLGTMPTS